jgi:hypothetical protein
MLRQGLRNRQDNAGERFLTGQQAPDLGFERAAFTARNDQPERLHEPADLVGELGRLWKAPHRSEGRLTVSTAPTDVSSDPIRPAGAVQAEFLRQSRFRGVLESTEVVHL